MSDYEVTAGTSFVVSFTAAPGLVGTVGVEIVTAAVPTVVVLARTTTGFAEDPVTATESIYTRAVTAPATPGRYLVNEDDTTSSFTETLLVKASGAATGLPGVVWPPPVADLIVLEPTIPALTSQSLVNAVAVLVERWTGRTFEPSTATRTLIADGSGTLTVADLRTVTTVSAVYRWGDPWLLPDGYRLVPALDPGWPAREIDLGMPLRAGTHVQVTGDWGWTEAPELALRGLAAWVADLTTTTDTPRDADGRPIRSETLEAYGVTFDLPADGQGREVSSDPPASAQRWLKPLRVTVLGAAV